MGLQPTARIAARAGHQINSGIIQVRIKVQRLLALLHAGCGANFILQWAKLWA